MRDRLPIFVDGSRAFWLSLTIMNTSDTPRTDAFMDRAIETKQKYPEYYCDFESFCHILEKELNEANVNIKFNAAEYLKQVEQMGLAIDIAKQKQKEAEHDRDVALEELRQWKRLQIWGETSEKVHDYIRARIIKGHKRMRMVAGKRDKYRGQLESIKKQLDAFLA